MIILLSAATIAISILISGARIALSINKLDEGFDNLNAFFESDDDDDDDIEDEWEDLKERLKKCEEKLNITEEE